MTTEQNNLLTEETQLVDVQSTAISSNPSQNSDDSTDIVEETDFKSWEKLDLVKAFHEAAKSSQVGQAIKQAMKIKLVLEEKYQEEKLNALQKFLAEGGVEDDFEYKQDTQLSEIDKEFKALKNKQRDFINDLNKKKQDNYKTRLTLLEQLRQLIDGQKTIPFKAIQEQWKKSSPIPQEFNEELWASYNALSERYYNNRSIDFELKELDRKKNLEIKLEICAKAEALANEPSINKSLDSLNFLHREYKHTGPVPEDQKEIIWQRFKAASDALYLRRDQFLKTKSDEQAQILGKKKEFLSKLESFTEFKGTETEQWKQKLAELEVLQKEWTTLGFSGKDDSAKEISKKYWELVKTFFKNKNEHYKKVYDALLENLNLKEELCKQAEALASETNAENSTKTVIDLQKKWKEIGHVPFKMRDKIYDRFKKACDEVFNKKRGVDKEKDSEYEQNLVLKMSLINELSALDPDSKESPAKFRELLADWKKVGFVPKKDITQVQSKYSETVKSFLDNSKQNEAEVKKIKLSLELDDLKSKPDAKNLLFKKEQFIKGKIKNLQTEADTLNNNLLFFSRSKNASSLAKDVENKVESLNKQILALEEELKLIKSA
ncbi:MAG: DUF349 domain-containing protein [Opitutaceae bacterium]|nr:DUF349 domain-containing protein [Cytophagales bacterium]